MAHDARCENANTAPSDCDCSCGGEQHGLGFMESKVHDLETDIREIEELKKLTPDEYFGDKGKGKDLLQESYNKLNKEIALANKYPDEDDLEDIEQLKRDRKRIVSIEKSGGMEWNTENWERCEEDENEFGLTRVWRNREPEKRKVENPSGLIEKVENTFATPVTVAITQHEVTGEYGIEPRRAWPPERKHPYEPYNNPHDAIEQATQWMMNNPDPSP